jgi:hypothetical protein
MQSRLTLHRCPSMRVSRAHAAGRKNISPTVLEWIAQMVGSESTSRSAGGMLSANLTATA